MSSSSSESVAVLEKEEELQLSQHFKRVVLTSVRKEEMQRARGYVKCILGPMFSGKTTELLRLHERHIRAGKSCLLVKFAGDTRYDKDCVATHDKRFGNGATVKATALIDIQDRLFDGDVDVVSIDEGQFFSDLAETVNALALAGKIIYVAALNGDFAKKPFLQVSELMPHCDDVTLLRAVCCCGLDATFTFRVTTDKKVVIIGGEDAYRAVCRDCYEKMTSERSSHDENENVGVGKACNECEMASPSLKRRIEDCPAAQKTARVA